MFGIFRWSVVILGLVLAFGALMRLSGLPIGSHERQRAIGQTALGMGVALSALSALRILPAPWDIGLLLLALALLGGAMLTGRHDTTRAR